MRPPRLRRLGSVATGIRSPMNLWTIFLILGIIAFVLIIVGRRRVDDP